MSHSSMGDFLKKFKLTKVNEKDQEIFNLANLDSGFIRKFIVKKVDESSLFRRNSNKSQKSSSSRNNSLKKRLKREAKQRRREDREAREERRREHRLSTGSLNVIKRSKSQTSLKSNLSFGSIKKARRGSFPSFGLFSWRPSENHSPSSSEAASESEEDGEHFIMTAKDRLNKIKDVDQQEPGFINPAFAIEEDEDEGIGVLLSGEELVKMTRSPHEDFDEPKIDLLSDDTNSIASSIGSESECSVEFTSRFNVKQSPRPQKRSTKRNYSPQSLYRHGQQSNRSSVSSTRKGILKKSASSTTINMEATSMPPSQPHTPSPQHQSRYQEPIDTPYQSNGGTPRYISEDALNHQRNLNRVKFILDSGKPDTVTGDYVDIKIDPKTIKFDSLRDKKIEEETSGLSRNGRKCLLFSAGLLVLTMAVILGSYFGSVKKDGFGQLALQSGNIYKGTVLEGRFKIISEKFAKELFNVDSEKFIEMSNHLETSMIESIFASQSVNEQNSTVRLKVVQYEKGSIISMFRIRWQNATSAEPLKVIRRRIMKHLNKWGAFGDYKIDKGSFTISEQRDICEGNPFRCMDECKLSEESLRFVCTCPETYVLVNSTLCLTKSDTTKEKSRPIEDVIAYVSKGSGALFKSLQSVKTKVVRTDTAKTAANETGAATNQTATTTTTISTTTPTTTTTTTTTTAATTTTTTATTTTTPPTSTNSSTSTTTPATTKESLTTKIEAIEDSVNNTRSISATTVSTITNISPSTDEVDTDSIDDLPMSESTVLKNITLGSDTNEDDETETIQDNQTVSSTESIGITTALHRAAIESDETTTVMSIPSPLNITTTSAVSTSMSNVNASESQETPEVSTKGTIIIPVVDSSSNISSTTIPLEESATIGSTKSTSDVDVATTKAPRADISSLETAKTISDTTVSNMESSNSTPVTQKISDTLSSLNTTTKAELSNVTDISKDTLSEVVSHISTNLDSLENITTTKEYDSTSSTINPISVEMLIENPTLTTTSIPQTVAKESSPSSTISSTIEITTGTSSTTTSAAKTLAPPVTSSQALTEISTIKLETTTKRPEETSSEKPDFFLAKSPTDVENETVYENLNTTSPLPEIYLTVDTDINEVTGINEESLQVSHKTEFDLPKDISKLNSSYSKGKYNISTQITELTGTTPSSETTESLIAKKFTTVSPAVSNIDTLTTVEIDHSSISNSSLDSMQVNATTPSSTTISDKITADKKEVITVHAIPVLTTTQPKLITLPNLTSTISTITASEDSKPSINFGIIDSVSNDLSFQNSAGKTTSPEQTVLKVEPVADVTTSVNHTTSTTATTTTATTTAATATSTTTTHPPVPKKQCTEDQFRCVKDGEDVCLPFELRCDSVYDCSDREDEKMCIENRCMNNFQCRWSGECLARQYVCDGIRHCTDGGDEEGCETWVCTDHEFSCPHSSTCLPVSLKCDGHMDCANGTDEIGCSDLECPANHFRCDDVNVQNETEEYQMCFPNLWRCDGEMDCHNGRDEMNCGCSGLDQSPCAVGGCVPTFEICDGLRHCADGSDEWGCVRIQNVTKELQVRTGQSRWSSVCGDKWSDTWTDLVCEQLGMGVTLLTDKRVPNELVPKPKVRLSPEAQFRSGRGRAPLLQYFLIHGECPKEPLVHVSCKEPVCGNWEIPEPAKTSSSSSQSADHWPSLGLLIQPDSYTNQTMAFNNACTATILTPTWVAAAYSCLGLKVDGLLAAKWALAVGKASSTSPRDGIEAGAVHTRKLSYIQHLIINPGAKRRHSLWRGDVVLLKLEKALDISHDVRPICLAEDTIATHDQCVIASWKDSEAGHSSAPRQTVQTLPVPNLTLNTCNTSYYAGRLHSGHTCASFLQSPHSSCTGPEGSPLMCQSSNGTWQLHGILSNVGNCASFKLPSVFTDIVTIKEWILNTIGRADQSLRSSIDTTTTTTAATIPIIDTLTGAELKNNPSLVPAISQGTNNLNTDTSKMPKSLQPTNDAVADAASQTHNGES